MSLMVSISGVRGIVGDSLTPDVVVRYVASFAEYCRGKKVVLGRDGRVTGKVIANLVSSTLLSMGSDVMVIGIAPTPTIQIAVEQLHAAGGISITASHNAIEWNGLKLIGKSGMFLTTDENNRFLSVVENNRPGYARWDKLGRQQIDDSFLRQHIDMVMSLPDLNVDQIRERNFKVVVDCINASGGLIMPQLLRSLGCEVIEMNCDVSGVFSRAPEPLPENLAELCKRVVKEKADLGIAVDPDADRLVLITEKGEPFGEEYTITSVAQFILSHVSTHSHKQPPTVVVNLSTTRAVDDVAKRFGAKIIRTPVGEINVAQKMKECGAVIGGEGSGGVIFPAVHFGRDAIVGAGLIMQQLAEFGGSLSKLKASLPQYAIAKTKVEVDRRVIDHVLETMARRYADEGTVDSRDGLKIDFKDSWVHLRKSNTEPIMRIIAEASTLARSQQVVQQFKDQVLSVRKSI
jgi:phosphomannomutase